MTDKSVEERRTHQSAMQFEALGRFVQAFEEMVHAVRSGCQYMTQAQGAHGELMTLVWNHRVMTANPLFELYRAMATVIINRTQLDSPSDENTNLLKIISDESKLFNSMIGVRNQLLHGTWSIDWSHQGQEDFSELRVYKFKTTPNGLRAENLPKHADELIELVRRCERSARVLQWLPVKLLLRADIRIERDADGAWDVPGAR